MTGGGRCHGSPPHTHPLDVRRVRTPAERWGRPERDHRRGAVRDPGAGPIEVLFAEGDYVEPDLVFVARGHETVLTDRGIEGPPDLVVEVVSPSTEARDRGLKLERYRHFGVGEYWIVDADRGTVDVWRRDASEPEVVSDILVWRVEGKSLDVSLGDLFRG